MEPQRRAPESGPNKQTAAPGAAAGKAPWFLKCAIGSLPEAELFESVEQRDEAIGELHKEVSRWNSRDLWIGIALLVTLGLMVRWFLLTVLSTLDWHPILKQVLFYAPMIGVHVGALWVLWRWDTRPVLREKLIARRIPVCRGCGYSLRGQTGDSKACPECGRTIDADVHAILAAGSRTTSAETASPRTNSPAESAR